MPLSSSRRKKLGEKGVYNPGKIQELKGGGEGMVVMMYKKRCTGDWVGGKKKRQGQKKENHLSKIPKGPPK